MENYHKKRVHEFLNNPKTLLAHTVQIMIIILIIYSGIDFAIQYMYAEYYTAHEIIFKQIEWMVVSIFIIEYLFRLWAAPSRKKYASSFYGVIDVLAIVPTFLATINLMPLRLLRLIRMTRLMRYWQDKTSTNTLTVSRIVQENILKNVIVVIGLLAVYEPVKVFIDSIAVEALGDVMFANSILALAAMFGFFAYSYADVNPQQLIERVLAHVTTATLLFPIGLMFILIQVILSVQLEQTPGIVIAAIWIVYLAVLLWDFANVLKVK